jgi:hypothetical protein
MGQIRLPHDVPHGSPVRQLRIPDDHDFDGCLEQALERFEVGRVRERLLGRRTVLEP